MDKPHRAKKVSFGEKSINFKRFSLCLQGRHFARKGLAPPAKRAYFGFNPSPELSFQSTIKFIDADTVGAGYEIDPNAHLDFMLIMTENIVSDLQSDCHVLCILMASLSHYKK